MGRKTRWPWSLRSTCSSSAQPRVLLVAGEWRVAGLPRGHPGGELLGLAPHQPLSSVAHFISFFFFNCPELQCQEEPLITAAQVVMRQNSTLIFVSIILWSGQGQL